MVHLHDLISWYSNVVQLTRSRVNLVFTMLLCKRTITVNNFHHQ